MAGETAFVEPARLIVSESCGQNLALPCGRGSLEAFELRHHTIKRLRPCHPRIGGHVLPGEQKAQEVARRDRLDLCSQSLERVMVDARQQSPLAPFFGGGFRRKAPAHRKAFSLKRGERDFDFGRGQTERTRKRVGADRPQPFQPAA